MTYGEKYSIGWESVNRSGFLVIYEKDYTGSSDISLKLVRGSVKITRNFDDFEDSRVLGMTCEFEIVNAKSDFFDLIDLLYATEKQYYVKVYDWEGALGSSLVITTLFEGFMNTDVAQEKYLNYSAIKIVASSYLSKMEYFSPAILDTVNGAATFLSFIQSAVDATGNTSNFRVRLSGNPSGVALGTGQTALNKTGVFTEMFWQNNVDKDSALDIVNEILKTFNAYMYWKDGYWYIEDYYGLQNDATIAAPNIHTKKYVEYAYNTSYGVDDSGTEVTTDSTEQVMETALKFANTSQTLHVIPGNKENELRLQEAHWKNALTIDFSGDETAHRTSTEHPNVDIRDWSHFHKSGEFTWDKVNESYLSIKYAKWRHWDSSVPLTTESKYYRGTYYGFCMNINLDIGTRLNIKWKFSEPDDTSIIYTIKPDFIHFRYYIRVHLKSEVNSIPAGWYYVKYYENDEYVNGLPAFWRLIPDTGQDVTSAISNEIKYNVSDYLDKIDKGGYVWNPSVEIPTAFLYDTGSLNFKALTNGSYDSVLGIVTTTYVKKVFPTTVDYAIPTIYMGDVEINTQENEIKNLFKTAINSDYLNKGKFNLKIFDLPNCNYGNGILTGTSDLDTYTENWEHKDEPYNPNISAQAPAPLHIIHLVQIIRQTMQARKKITSDVLESDLLHVGDMFISSASGSSVRYILMGFVHHVDTGIYEVDLREYDRDTQVIINDYFD